MVQSDIELHFKPEKHMLCFLLDSPILLSVIVVSLIFVDILHFLSGLMTFILISSSAVWILSVLKYNRDCDATEVRVYPDRIESEVGVKNPKLTMIEFTNLKEVKRTQSFIQKIFKTYSIVFIYKSDFDETKNMVYTLRDFKDPKHICDVIKQTVDHAGLLEKMT